MKCRVLIHTADITPGCEANEASKELRKIANELEKMTITAPQRLGIKDINGKSIGFWSIER